MYSYRSLTLRALVILGGFFVGLFFLLALKASLQAHTLVARGVFGKETFPIMSEETMASQQLQSTLVKDAHIHTQQQQQQHSPKFIIGGAMKCGTNEAMKLIQHHPRIKFNTCSMHNTSNCNAANYQGVQDENGEISIWECSPKDLLDGRVSSRSFAERFAKTDGETSVTVDKSPAFLDTFQRRNLPALISKLLPGTKMVFTLCDPAERLVSEYYHNHRQTFLEENFAKSSFSVGCNHLLPCEIFCKSSH